jgi:NADH-quinone oxidoreductase subunit E
VSCYVMGCDQLRVALQEKLGIEPGETTSDGRFTLLPIVCLGACDHAPAMMIDEDLILDAAPQKLDAVFGRYT